MPKSNPSMARRVRCLGLCGWLALLLLPAALVACDPFATEAEPEPSPTVAKIELATGLTLKVGETVALGVTVTDTTGAPMDLPAAELVFEFVSGDYRLSIAGGQAKGIAPGDAVVTVSARGKTSLPAAVKVLLRRYRVTDLLAPGGEVVRAAAINAGGQVTGTLTRPDGVTRAFVWTPDRPNGTAGTLQDLGILTGFVSASAADINDSGQVVGRLRDANGNVSEAFVWHAGAFTILNGVPGFSSGGAVAINQTGQVLFLTGGRPYIWDQGRLIDVTALHNASVWDVRDLNDSGTAVGRLTIGPGAGFQQGWKYEGGQYISLGGALPVAINNNGQIISVYQSGTPDPIPFGLNNLGQIVGVVRDANGLRRAVIVEGGATYDLTEMLPAGWWLEDAAAINDAGQIVAHFDGHAVLLTPER